MRSTILKSTNKVGGYILRECNCWLIWERTYLIKDPSVIPTLLINMQTNIFDPARSIKWTAESDVKGLNNEKQQA